MVARYHAYQARLATAQAVDFDDLVRLPVQLLSSTPRSPLPSMRATSGSRWTSIKMSTRRNTSCCVLLAAGGANVCVIGDPDQAIYSFRGASPPISTPLSMTSRAR